MKARLDREALHSVAEMLYRERPYLDLSMKSLETLVSDVLIAYAHYQQPPKG